MCWSEIILNLDKGCAQWWQGGGSEGSNDPLKILGGKFLLSEKIKKLAKCCE